MKNSAVVSERQLRLREVKKEASRRCRARAIAIANGELLSLDLAIRSLQPTSLKVENFKMEVAGKSVRLNKNGGEKVAMIVTEKGTKTRKSFQNLRKAIEAFNIEVGA